MSLRRGALVGMTAAILGIAGGAAVSRRLRLSRTRPWLSVRRHSPKHLVPVSGSVCLCRTRRGTR